MGSLRQAYDMLCASLMYFYANVCTSEAMAYIAQGIFVIATVTVMYIHVHNKSLSVCNMYAHVHVRVHVLTCITHGNVALCRTWLVYYRLLSYEKVASQCTTCMRRVHPTK